MSILLDSDIVIELLRGRDPEILERWDRLAGSMQRVLHTPVTSAEVWAGTRPRERELTANLFASIECVPLDGETGVLAGRFLKQFAASHGLKIADALIAAAAVQHSAALWTRNRKHYPMPELHFY